MTLAKVVADLHALAQFTSNAPAKFIDYTDSTDGEQNEDDSVKSRFVVMITPQLHMGAGNSVQCSNTYPCPNKATGLGIPVPLWLGGKTLQNTEEPSKSAISSLGTCVQTCEFGFFTRMRTVGSQCPGCSSSFVPRGGSSAGTCQLA